MKHLRIFLQRPRIIVILRLVLIVLIVPWILILGAGRVWGEEDHVLGILRAAHDWVCPEPGNRNTRKSVLLKNFKTSCSQWRPKDYCLRVKFIAFWFWDGLISVCKRIIILWNQYPNGQLVSPRVLQSSKNTALPLPSSMGRIQNPFST